MKLKKYQVKFANNLVIALLFIFSSTFSYSLPFLKESNSKGETIRIGIIGAENSHTIGFGKLFNI